MRCYSTESSSLAAEKHEFKAETKKLLHIVAHSLYSQREVFVRELISNSSDALEKLRHLQATSQDVNTDKPLEVNIEVDSDNKTITFYDSGIGMSADELKENLGTIARSGSKAYIEKMQDGADTKDMASTIVGQFGVGFYSAFMVGDKITVYTRSANPGSEGYCWESDGLGSYTLSKADNVDVGTKIVINIKDDAKEYLEKGKLDQIIKKYSNFVGFPITVNGEKVNTVEALWTKDKNSITEDEHTDFYRFVSRAWDEPMYNLVYKADGPLSIRSILYAPTKNPEDMGFDRIKPGVSLYSRKVLIMPNAEGLLPEWLRFVQGVVDSEDLPLNLSRELLQNGPIIQRLKSIITSRIIKWLQEESNRDAEKYAKFFQTFAVFIKEGVCQDMANQAEISKLLRFETSNKDAGQLISLGEYVESMPSDQEHIYYFCTPNREFGIDSPYYEPFKKHGANVLFLHHALDEFVMGRLATFEGKRLVSVDSEDAGKVLKKWNDADQAESSGDSGVALTTEQTDELTAWMLPNLGTSVKEVKVSERFMSYPAIVTDFDSPAVRRMMKMMAGDSKQSIPMSPCTVEINSSDPIIKGLYALKDKDEDLARKVAQQLLDNALIAAGIMDDPRSMIKRLNDILVSTVSK
ncbi:chaperone protein htpG [Kickxella alabastrina]|uniref:chaperone protein htpG n=1 Tax=Kickxella alabastrina TaxID=61397 RepID=UPI00221F9BCD|nr:chaperone protein htpG [Kickxella alabastrina]KAI7833311.1 chaperone protein htpG [Kickxella alabastrina]